MTDEEAQLEVDRLYPYDPTRKLEELEGVEKCRAMQNRTLARIHYRTLMWWQKHPPQYTPRKPRLRKPGRDQWDKDFPDHKARASGEKT